MIVRVDGKSDLSLEDPLNMRSLKVVAASAAAIRAATQGGPIELAPDGHAWISPGWIAEQSGHAASPEWRDAFAKMVAFATSKGWVRPNDGAIRAHVEYAQD